MIKQGSQGRLLEDEDEMGEKQVQKNLIRTSLSRPPEKRLKVPELNKAEISLVIAAAVAVQNSFICLVFV